MDLTLRQHIRSVVTLYYDIQKLRIGARMRTMLHPGNETNPLLDTEKLFVDAAFKDLENLEKDCVKELRRLLKGAPIWTDWLEHEVKGVGPTMAAVLVAWIDIHRVEYPSQLWSYCGLAVDGETGRAVRKTKGKKTGYNPWLKAKVLEVMGKCMVKAKSEGYYETYVNRKHRRQSQMIDVCMGCLGTGRVTARAEDEESREKEVEQQTEAAVQAELAVLRPPTTSDEPTENATKAFLKAQRAALRQTTGNEKRAVEKQEPEPEQRAEITEPPVRENRAAPTDHPEPIQRAERSKQTDLTQRAGEKKPPQPEKRAAIPELPVSQLRAELEKTPEPRQRADINEQPKEKKRTTKCPNCSGTGGPAPWGRSNAHREIDARRYMVKMFLIDLYKKWRTLEGLSVRPSYHEQQLGHVHHKAI